MKLTENVWVCRNRKNELWSNITGVAKMYDVFDEHYDIVNNLLFMSRQKRRYSQSDILRAVYAAKTQINGGQLPEDDTEKFEQQKLEVKLGIERLMSFFTEFNFEPNFRFVNTLSETLNYSIADGQTYIKNYFELTDNAFVNAIIEKMKSTEFSEILTSLALLKPKTIINKRFKLYYGSQGTGKTTQAMKEADGNCMVCHSAMLPSDLMEDFKFDDGKATFTPSALCKAMTEGKTIVLDEINLLPFESLRFLQSLLDGKTQFEYKGQTINIVDGFNIIGTMNLQVNGQVYALPEPLVDRAAELKEFKLTADTLLGAII